MTSNVITIAGHNVTPVTVKDAIEHFLNRKRLRGAALNTIIAYQSDLDDFAGFAELQDIGLIGLVGERVIERWLDRLGHRGLSTRSQARKLSCLRMLMRHAIREGWCKYDATTDINLSFETMPVIAPELKPMLAMLDGMPIEKPMDLRDRAMLRLALDAALRVSDAVQLDLPPPNSPPRMGVDLTRLTVHCIGKGNKPACLPINQRTADWVSEWLAVRAKMAKGTATALFVSNRGTRMTRQQAHNRIKHWGMQFDLPQLHFHLMRHRRIGEVIETLGIDAGQHLARHKKRSTTINVYGMHAANVVRHQLRSHADLDAPRAKAAAL